MKFLFIPQSCLPFHGRSLDERPLGGIETGIIRLTEELAKMGHEVTVLSQAENPPLTPALYIPAKALEQVKRTDVLVAVRDWTPILIPIEAKLRLYWTGDSYDQPQNLGIGDRRIQDRINAFLAVSNWHADRVCEESGFPRSRAWVIRNGVHLEYFQGAEPRVRKRLIYSSTPYRGLRFLPSIFAEIVKRHPDAELHVFSGFDVYGGAASFPRQAQEEFERIRAALKALPRCFLRGNVKQSELAREFMRSAILAYPNTFEETSCITALEAQAAGCVTVTSRLGALEETVQDSGILIDGPIGSSTYLERFIASLDRLLTDDSFFNTMSSEATKLGREAGWTTVATRLLKFIEASKAFD